MTFANKTDGEEHKIQRSFFGLGMQYYAVARYAAMATLMPVCGNLYHHAIEMFLKGGLSQTNTLKELKDLGHNLLRIWDAFKAEFSSAVLGQFDYTIKTLDQFESIRYPDKIIPEGIQLVLIWGPDIVAPVYAPEIRPPIFQVVVPDIDHLVKTIFEVCSADPRDYAGSLNVYAYDALAKHNPACDWL